MRVLQHIAVSGLALFLCLGLPGLVFAGQSGLLARDPDAVTSATVPVPDQPSGTYYVLINDALRPDSLEDWSAFYQEEEVGVIMEDVSCIVMDSDAAAIALAERYQLRLAEHQMTLRRENPLLVVSRAEQDAFDTIIVSAEMAEAYAFSEAMKRTGTTVLCIEGGSSGDETGESEAVEMGTHDAGFSGEDEAAEKENAGRVNPEDSVGAVKESADGVTPEDSGSDGSGDAGE